MSRARVNPHLPDALKLVNQLRSLKGLRIRGVRVDLEDLPLVCLHSEIETLQEVELDQKTLASIQQMPNLKSLHLDLNKIESLEGCRPFPRVQHLTLSGNPIRDNYSRSRES